MGGADIFITKEIIRKIPSKSGCQAISIEEFAKCLRQELQKNLEMQQLSSNLKCKVPAMDFNLKLNLNYCTSTSDALKMEKIIYKKESTARFRFMSVHALLHDLFLET